MYRLQKFKLFYIFEFIHKIGTEEKGSVNLKP